MKFKATTKKIASNLRKEILFQIPSTQAKGVLFDHIPKCGGKTLNKYLESHYPSRKIYATGGANNAELLEKFANLTEEERNSYSLVRGHFVNGFIDLVRPEFVKVVVFRDPIERIMSHYYYAKSAPRHYLHSKIHDEELSLEDYATSNLSVELRNWYTTYFSGFSADEAEENPEESIEKAVDFVLKSYDVIGFLDNFELFIKKLREHANLKYEYDDNDRVNVTQGRPKAKEVPQAVVEKIRQVNHLDIVVYQKIKDSVG